MKVFLSILAAAATVCTTATAKTLTSLREVEEVCRTSSGTNDVFDLNCKISYFYQSHSAARWRLVATEGADEIVLYETKNARSDFGADEMPHLNDIFHIKGNFFLRDGAWCAGYTSAVPFPSPAAASPRLDSRKRTLSSCISTMRHGRRRKDARSPAPNRKTSASTR